MNRNAFDRLVLAIARGEYPQHRWTVENGQLVSRSADGEKIQSSLANLYAQTPRDDGTRMPGSRRAWRACKTWGPTASMATGPPNAPTSTRWCGRSAS